MGGLKVLLGVFVMRHEVWADGFLFAHDGLTPVRAGTCQYMIP